VNGRLDLSFNSISNVQVGDLRVTFSPSNSLYSQAFEFAEEDLRLQLEALAEEGLELAIREVVGSVIGAFDFGTLTQTLYAPPFSSGSEFESELSGELGSLSITSGGLNLFMDADWTAGPSEAEPPATLPDLPLPLLNSTTYTTTGDDFSYSINIDLINKGLALLWRYGYFDFEVADLSAPILSGNSIDFATLRFRTLLPPMMSVRNSELVFSMGGITTDIFTLLAGDTGIEYDTRLSADFVVDFVVSGEGTLALNGLVDSRILSSVNPFNQRPDDLDRASGLISNQLDLFGSIGGLGSLVQFPLPALEGTAATAILGLPAGELFGLTSPQLDTLQHLLQISGEFGVLP
jgi:hypothetical protein